MFCKRLSLGLAVPAFLSKSLYSELKSLKINRRIRLFRSESHRDNYVFASRKQISEPALGQCQTREAS